MNHCSGSKSWMDIEAGSHTLSDFVILWLL